MAAKVDGVLEALVNHATRHGGEGAKDILDAWATYQGEPTADERTKEAQEEADKEQEEGKAANRKQVEDEKAKAAKEADDKKDGK